MTTASQASSSNASSKRMIDALRTIRRSSCGSPFNEGWGQYDTADIVALVKAARPHAAGRTTPAAGPTATAATSSTCTTTRAPACGPVEPTARRVLGEFGGLGLPVRGHTWQGQKLGLPHLQNAARAHAAYVSLIDKLARSSANGLSRRRLHPNDRCRSRSQRPDDLRPRELKMDADQIAAAAARLYQAPAAPTSPAASASAPEPVANERDKGRTQAGQSSR